MSRIAKFVRRSVYLLLALLLLLLGLLYLLYRSTPGWYQPRQLSDQQLQQVSAVLNGQVSSFHAQASAVPAAQPVVIELTQEQANAYLQALPRLYDRRLTLPGGLSDPMIVFEPDRLILACRLPQTGRRPVSLHLKLRVEPETVTLAVERVQIGSLPLPEQLVRDQIDELRHKLGQLADRTGGKGRNTGVELGLLLFRALDGRPLPREFVTPNANRRVRLDRVELGDARMTLTFLPQGDPPAQPNRPSWTDQPIGP